MTNKNYEALIQIGGKVNPSLSKAAQNTCRHINNIQNSIKNTALNGVKIFAGLFAIDKIKNLGLGMIGSAETMESYRNTLNIVMKDQVKAAKMMKWAVDFANKTPFDTESIVQASVRLTAYGIDAQKSMSDIGNMASVMNKPIMQAVEAIADAQTGELERLKEFGITKNMIALKANQMYRNQEIINKKGQITDQQRFNNALLQIMKERYTDGMIVQSKTWQGVKSTILGVWQTAMAQMAGISKEGTIKAGSIFDVLTKKGYELSVILQKMANDGTFEKISEKIAMAMSLTVEALKSTYKACVKLYNFIQKNRAIITTIGFFILLQAAYFKTAQTLEFLRYQQVLANMAIASGARITPLMLLANGKLTASLKLLTLNLWGSVKAILAQSAAWLANPWTWIILMLSILIYKTIELVTHWNEAKAVMSSAWNTIKSTVQSACMNITTNILTLWIKIKPIFEKIRNAAKIAFNFTPVGLVYNGINAVNTKLQHKPLKKNALGSSSFSGGTTLVGEQGPELINLPRGTQIFSNTKTNLLLNKDRGININITINGNATPQTIQEAAESAFNEFKNKYDAMISKNRRLGYI